MHTIASFKHQKAMPFWLLKALKIGIGCSLAVLICELCGLQYATFAGIVTLLTIRNNKRDTMIIAGKRMLSFLLTMAAITVIWNIVDHSSLRFMLFMVALATASCFVKWEDTISVNAVVGGHMLMLDANMTASFFGNELALMIVGLGSAIVLNWYMPAVLHELQDDIIYVEAELHDILHRIAAQLRKTQSLTCQPVRLLALREHIDAASEKALYNMNNHLTVSGYSHSNYYVKYLHMRKSQCVLLLQCHQALVDIAHACPEVDQLAEIIEKIADSVHHKVGIRAIIAELEEIVCHMKTEALPQTTTEFVAAAQIFHLLELFEALLREKRAFLMTLTERERALYWKE